VIEIEEHLFGYGEGCKWLLTDEHICDVYWILEQLYSQMMGWA